MKWIKTSANLKKKNPIAAGCTTGRTFQNKTPCAVSFRFKFYLVALQVEPELISDLCYLPSLLLILLHCSALCHSRYLVIKKPRNLKINQHLWRQYIKKKSFFFFFFTHRIKLHDETFPRLLRSSSRILRVRLVHPLSSERQAPAEREHMFFSPRQPGRRAAFPSFESWFVAGTCLGGETCILRAALGFRLAFLLPLLSCIAVLRLAVAEH